ncbi:hypothetical protein BDP81DRAFT_387990 [Colletotrichum phormii]|uniref:Uncharacterized protein n=1 Tax=Colletotrichum phormii TaxID=359342 RepID=A0AAI9ZBZ0_9PEZI|nr:uncharacterized protein BDP81DRAFT_387990 [Colletotrichum phormii]KAK1613538.1 hypothetical protein BDP81DRAFT_387990 [Colletotrichum phormii]
MEPFIFYEEYALAICKTCQFAVVSDELATHLRTRHRHIPPSTRSSIVKAISGIMGIRTNQASLTQLQYPDPSTAPIDHLTDPRTDGIQYHRYSYIYRQTQRIQDHYQKHHG